MGLKLHLGCGHKYLDGWVNVDGPKEDLCYDDLKADVHARIEDLSYPNESVSQILIEAVFEHFPRHMAVLQLRKFYNWLEDGGTIEIVVPDFFATVEKLKQSSTPEEQQFWWRHIFGPQDTIEFGTHYDGFDEEKLEYIFSVVGFRRFACRKEGGWPNLRFTAKKTKPFLPEAEARHNMVRYMALYEAKDEPGMAFGAWMKAMGFEISKKPATPRLRSQQPTGLLRLRRMLANIRSGLLR